MDSTQLLAQEWQTLQNNHEQYEKHALLIKLTCLVLTTAGMATSVPLFWMTITVLLCWGQEAIFKTWQSRLADRLMVVESLVKVPAPQPSLPMQLHTGWLASRPGTTAMVSAYVSHAAKPTVAFPYLPMLVLGGMAYLLQWL